MPLAIRSVRGTYQTGFYYSPPGVLVPPDSDPIEAGIAVAIRSVDGQTVYVPCGALAGNYPNSFIGFMDATAQPNETARVKVGRGAVLQPVVENDESLTPDMDVYLSSVPGRVTQNNLSVPGMVRLRLGVAISLTQMILVTDFRYEWVG